MSSSPVVCSCKEHSRMATNKTPEQREARLARRREQYRQRHVAETARRRRAMESASDRNARLPQVRRHQWKRVSTETSWERETSAASSSDFQPRKISMVIIKNITCHKSFCKCRYSVVHSELRYVSMT